MQTVTVAHINQPRVNTTVFLNRARELNIRRPILGDRRQYETLTAPFVERIDSVNNRVNVLATGVIRNNHPDLVVDTRLRNGYVERVEREERIEDFARVWLGHRNYALFCFLTRSPGGSYPAHRRFLAQSLTADELDDDQQLVVPIDYNLTSVRQRFGNNIWDQNFLRDEAIRRGRIRGTAMQNDPLYHEFEHIGTYIGVEIPITGSLQMVKVLSGGRLQFMGLQPQVLENPATREAALDVVIQVVDRLTQCEA